MSEKQFAGRELEALDILERGVWRSIERNLKDLEVALALLCEATQPALRAREDNEFESRLSGGRVPMRDEVTEMIQEDDYELLSYVASLVERLCLSYGVDPIVGEQGPERSVYRKDAAPPAGWRNDHDRGIAALLHGLDDLLDE